MPNFVGGMDLATDSSLQILDRHKAPIAKANLGLRVTAKMVMGQSESKTCCVDIQQEQIIPSCNWLNHSSHSPPQAGAW